MRKRLSGGQKWFLRPYFSLIRGMFVFRSGLILSFQALEVPEPRVRKMSKMTGYARDMPKICPRYAQDMPKICPRYARDMPKICLRYA